MEAITQPKKKQYKKKKNAQKTFKQIDPTFPEFKQAEKKYRLYKDYITDFSGLLTFSENFDVSPYPIEKKEIGGLTVFKFLEPQGAYLVKNFMEIPEQIHLTMKCLNEYNRKPYRTNLFIYENDAKTNQNDENNKNDTEEKQIEKEEEEKLKIKNKEEEEKSYNNDLGPYNKERFYVCDYSRYCFDRKIRWSNVGYQYDWNNRTYPAEKTSLPIDLLNLANKTAQFIKNELPDVLDYKAESTIINYYDSKNFMGGHLDDGEKDQKSPIFSYNFGLSCVFLMGGKTKDSKPLAIQLDSGDLFIMSGYSRTCYHGVPRILEDSFNYKPFEEFVKTNCAKSLEEISTNGKVVSEKNEFINNEVHAINYLKENRLNLNFRQVFN